jgi:hypothetical protein
MKKIIRNCRVAQSHIIHFHLFYELNIPGNVMLLKYANTSHDTQFWKNETLVFMFTGNAMLLKSVISLLMSLLSLSFVVILMFVFLFVQR